MSNNAIETVMGGVVLAAAAGFLYFAYDKSNVKPVSGYSLVASFSNISGIAAGSPVRIGGIKVGVVEDLSLNKESYQAVAKVRIEQDVKIPRDSSAAVQSTGLIGEKFLSIEPGGDEESLKDGEKISFTQPSVNLEEMIGKFVFSGGGADKAAPPPDGKAATEKGKSDGIPALE